MSKNTKKHVLARNGSGSVGIKKFRCKSTRLGQGTSKIVALAKALQIVYEKQGCSI